MSTINEPPKPFSFDVQEALRSGFYVSGTTGCGKSHVAMHAADMLMKEGVRVIVIDPSEDWEENSNISNIIRIQKLPISLSLNINTSLILDTKTLTILEEQKFVEEFCRLIFEKQVSTPREKRKYFVIVFEEGQTKLPEGCLRARKFQNTVRLLSVSRNYKIRMGAITPFAASLDKAVLKYMRQRYFGATDEKNDINYIAEFIGKEDAQNLKYFKAGEFLYYYPLKRIQEKIYSDFHKRTVKLNGNYLSVKVEEPGDLEEEVELQEGEGDS